MVRPALPVLAEAAAAVGNVRIRNRGTIGGSLAHADPAAELPCVAVALGAEVTARGPDGARDACRPATCSCSYLDDQRSSPTRSSPRCASPRCRAAQRLVASWRCSRRTLGLRDGRRGRRGRARRATGRSPAARVALGGVADRAARPSRPRCSPDLTGAAADGRRGSNAVAARAAAMLARPTTTCTPRRPTGGGSPRSSAAARCAEASRRHAARSGGVSEPDGCSVLTRQRRASARPGCARTTACSTCSATMLGHPRSSTAAARGCAGPARCCSTASRSTPA